TVRGILNATDYIVAPSKCSLIDTNGINDLIKIYFIGKRNNPKLELKKVFFVQVEERTRVFADALKEYTDFFNSNDLGLSPNILSKNYIRKDSNINNAMLENLDIITYKKSSPSSTDYRNIANELIKELE
ncbi:hypothetical protein HMPREF3180_01658, partial [Leptotrichia wadei]